MCDIYITYCWKSSLNFRPKSSPLPMKKLRQKDTGYLILWNEIYSEIYKIFIIPLLKDIILGMLFSNDVLAF